MEEISDIPSNQFYSFEDEDGFVYGFDIVSLYNLLFGEVTMSSRIRRIAPINPYNRRPITKGLNAICQHRRLKEQHSVT